LLRVTAVRRTPTIRGMVAADWPAVEEIYRQGIQEGEATFETRTPTWDAFDAGRLAAPRLVVVDDPGRVLGWAAASAVSARPAYRGVIEHSVYVHRDARGRGLGRQLLAAFVEASDAGGFWTIQSSIFPENDASLRIHQAAGFRIVGSRERIARSSLGAHAGQWRDTVMIERRSTVNGVEGSGGESGRA
jgi:L-amino acid N-acyltransferase YncA